MKLDTALKKAEAATTPTSEQIADIETAKGELDKAIEDAADGVDTKTDQITMLLNGYEGRLEKIKGEDNQVVASNGGPPPPPPPPPAKTSAADLGKAAAALMTALDEGEDGIPTAKEIGDIVSARTMLRNLLGNLDTGVDSSPEHTTAQNLLNGDTAADAGTPASMTYVQRLAAIRLAFPPQMTLNTAVMNLKTALEVQEQSGATPMTTDITDIEEFHAALLTALMADGVDNTEAHELLVGDGTILSYTARLDAIRANVPGMPEQPEVLADRPTTEIEYDATFDNGDGTMGRWTIDISSGLGGASHEVTVVDTHGWISVTSETSVAPGRGAENTGNNIYAIAVYGKSKDDAANDFDDDDRMGFGAWVSDSGIIVGNTDSVPVLIEGGAAIGGNDPAPATGREYLGAKTGTASYRGDVVGITESDGDITNPVYDPQYLPWIGEITLTADFDNNTLNGSISRGRHDDPIPTDTIAFEEGAISNYMASGNINNGQSEDSGDWNARFVHQGRWIVGDFDYQPNGTDTTLNTATENDSTADPDPEGFTYIRHRGAFGAVEQP